VAGAGPAGASAAITALRLGAGVTLFDPASPRHKVCGEFLSAEVEPVLRDLGVWDRIIAAGAVRYERLILHFGRVTRTTVFAERPLGLSRFALDRVLLDEALRAGARLERARAENPAIIAHGRKLAASGGRRVFAFKAHFQGPVGDEVELYFADGWYVGVNRVENGVTNVCGLAGEAILRRFGFSPSALLDSWEPLRERLRPLARSMKWLMTGPLVFGRHGACATYRAGDAFSFADPFTGSGLLAAMLTGCSAGEAAALGRPVAEHERWCRSLLRRQSAVSCVFRFLLRTGAAELLSGFVPAGWLVAATRPGRPEQA